MKLSERKAALLRGKTKDELTDMLRHCQRDLMSMRFKKKSGGVENTNRFRFVRRRIAQIKTLLNNPA
jgi:ribosomal protein L29